jgi:hypothetical protein
MTIITAQNRFYYPADLAGKRRVCITLDSGESLTLKYVIYPSSGAMQTEVNKYEAWKAAEPARILAEKLARIRQEMAENGITELK